MCWYYFKTLLVKQGTFLYECGQIWQRRGIYLTQDFDIVRKLTLKNLFIGELLVTSENRTLHFSDSGIFVDGRKKEKGICKLKIN